MPPQMYSDPSDEDEYLTADTPVPATDPRRIDPRDYDFPRRAPASPPAQLRLPSLPRSVPRDTTAHLPLPPLTQATLPGTPRFSPPHGPSVSSLPTPPPAPNPLNEPRRNHRAGGLHADTRLRLALHTHFWTRYGVAAHTLQTFLALDRALYPHPDHARYFRPPLGRWDCLQEVEALARRVWDDTDQLADGSRWVFKSWTQREVAQMAADAAGEVGCGGQPQFEEVILEMCCQIVERQKWRCQEFVNCNWRRGARWVGEDREYLIQTAEDSDGDSPTDYDYDDYDDAEYRDTSRGHQDDIVYADDAEDLHSPPDNEYDGDDGDGDGRLLTDYDDYSSESSEEGDLLREFRDAMRMGRAMPKTVAEEYEHDLTGAGRRDGGGDGDCDGGLDRALGYVHNRREMQDKDKREEREGEMVVR
ncbi:hypothetical protein EDC01DRAFT_732785 [Geopyxis carbonaria]|nr:hypothetical protein EDC01DRAFT_732785 [Geopyxis carbonaria]